MVAIVSALAADPAGRRRVFVVSSVIHMFLGYHWNDCGAVPNRTP